MINPADILRTHYAQRCQGELFLEAAHGGGINSQNYLVRTGDPASMPKFVLKVETLGESTAGWAEQVAFHQQVAECVSLVPPLISTDDKQTGFVADGKLWRLLEFRGGDIFSGTREELINAARGLALLQKNIRHLPGAKSISPLYDHFTEVEIEEILKILKDPAWKNTFGIKAGYQVQVTMPPRLIQMIDENKDLMRGWVHRDFHPGNALFSGGKLTAILDLDSLATDFRMQAVTFAASRFAGNDIPRLWTFLGAYHTVDPLTAAELKLVPDFIRREAARRLNWIIRVNVLQGQNLWREDLDKQVNIIQRSQELHDVFAPSETELLKTINQAAAATGSGKP